MQVKLDERLAACAGFVREGSRVADVGTDHALLPCYLWQSGAVKDIIASDIAEKPLERARETARRYNAEVRLVLSDGFEKLPVCDDIIIAGMGGETILEILAGCYFKEQNSKNARFILQPMTRHEELRRGLYAQGFEIIEEAFAADRGKPYTVIYARYTGEKRVIDDVFAFIGKQRHPDYIKKQLTRIRKLGKGDPKYGAIAAEIEGKYYDG